MRDVIEAIVQVDEGSAWLEATTPVDVVETRVIEAVPAVIRRAEWLAASRGWFAVGFLAYEAGRAFGIDAHDIAGGWPLAWFALFDPASVRRVATPGPCGQYDVDSLEPSIGELAFRKAFARIHEHLAAGDTYQVNYTFRIRGAFSGDPRAMFRDLVSAQRCRYGAFLRFGHRAICCASPELFFARNGPDVMTRPMKGTAPRGRTLAEDEIERNALLNSPKQRAENVMIVDMMRNDLGRVAESGSVEVPALFVAERYPNVWQMTSTVRARTAAPVEALVAALHPAASVTGAPKVRTAQIIRALEPGPRGVYTGAIGHITPGGRAQFSVAIRTTTIDEETGHFEFGVGSGIVSDSDPTDEYGECLLKASVLGQRPASFELLETLRWAPDEGFVLLERHLRRLCDSADYFGFTCDVPRVRAALDRAVASVAGSLRIRLLVAEDGSVRTEQAPFDRASQPLRVGIAAGPIDPGDAFLFHKTTNRAVYERVRRAEYDDTVLWNPRREVTEATTANVVAEIDGRRVTPPVACGLLAGTFRAELVATGQISERPITLDELFASHRVWLINSVHGWRLAVLDSLGR